MSNIVLANAKVPAFLAKRIGTPSTLAAALTGGIGSGVSYPRISIKSSRFRIVEGETETVLDSTKLEVIIVGANPKLSKTWYAKKWSKDAEPGAPDCYSLNGETPEPDSTAVQNDLCATCPQNAWGSKVTDEGREVKACADTKRLAVVAADDPEGSIYLLTVTPAALKGLNQYQKELSMRGIPPEIVKTVVGFDTDASFPKLTFSFGGYLDEETYNTIEGLFGSDKVKEVTGEGARAVQAPQIENKPRAASVTAKAEPAPEPAATVVEEAEQPKATKGFGKGKTVKAEPAEEVVQQEEAPKQTKPAAVVKADAGADALADEIAALIGGQASDE